MKNTINLEIKKITDILRLFYVNRDSFQKPLMKSIIVSFSYLFFKNNIKEKNNFREECGYIIKK